ncbi:MAG TPA: hypothetical protein VEZ11_19100 [Thermoanaerobaculia bacterium]|nr:hypothetical protein [Thermoanaerobaculia bacterium]
MQSRTALKLAIAAIVVILFAGIILRLATRLFVVATHSLLTAILIVAIVVWAVMKMK